jgi:PIN domain nuclease of toxin-antitoxin system
VRLLLDTHFLIWLIRDPGELLPKEQGVISDPATELMLSVASIWELRIKWNTLRADGRRKGRVSPSYGLDYALANDIALLPLTPQDTATNLLVSPPHGDPFDEILLVHAQRHDARLLTRDRQLVDHPLALQL